MENKSRRPGDEMERLVREHEQRIYRAALAVTGNRADAEDATQETFLRAMEKAPEFESTEHEKAWLLRVTVNICRDRLRSPWRGRVVPLTESYPAREPETRGVPEAVMALPPKYRAVIHLYYYEGYSVREIANLTGRREPTVRSLMTRARQKLGSLLKEDDDERI